MATKAVSRQDLMRVIKEIHGYKQSTDKEIRLLKTKITKLQKTIEKSVIPEDDPDSYENKAVKEFESRRKKGDVKFVPLDSD